MTSKKVLEGVFKGDQNKMQRGTIAATRLAITNLQGTVLELVSEIERLKAEAAGVTIDSEDLRGTIGNELMDDGDAIGGL